MSLDERAAIEIDRFGIAVWEIRERLKAPNDLFLRDLALAYLRNAYELGCGATYRVLLRRGVYLTKESATVIHAGARLGLMHTAGVWERISRVVAGDDLDTPAEDPVLVGVFLREVAAPAFDDLLLTLKADFETTQAAAEILRESDANFGLPPLFAAELRDIFARAPDELSRTYVFGSRARGAWRDDSDVDLAVDAPDWSNEEFANYRLKFDEIVESSKTRPSFLGVDLTHLNRIETQEYRQRVQRDRKLFWERMPK